METRYLVEGSFVSEFRAICNHCVVMAEWSRKTLKFCLIFLAFFGKMTHYGKIFKMLCRNFLSRHQSTCCVQISRNLAGEIVRYLTNQKNNDKNSPASQTVATARIAPKIYQCQPTTVYSECSRFHPNRLAFGVITAESPRKVNPIFGLSLSSSRIIIVQEKAKAAIRALIKWTPTAECHLWIEDQSHYSVSPAEH